MTTINIEKRPAFDISAAAYGSHEPTSIPRDDNAEPHSATEAYCQQNHAATSACLMVLDRVHLNAARSEAADPKTDINHRPTHDFH